MGTPYSTIYDAYFAKVKDDFYQSMDKIELEIELIKIMEAALPRFLYPAIDLEARDNIKQEFDEVLTNAEIQIIATLMNQIWVEKQISDIEITRQVFRDHDFNLTSQASHLRSLLALQQILESQIRKMMHNYTKVKNRQPDFSGLAGSWD
jgi:predicted component of type VI protein secretion system